MKFVNLLDANKKKEITSDQLPKIPTVEQIINDLTPSDDKVLIPESAVNMLLEEQKFDKITELLSSLQKLNELLQQKEEAQSALIVLQQKYDELIATRNELEQELHRMKQQLTQMLGIE